MKYTTGDLLEAVNEIDALVHVANLYHTFGSGIALSISRKYPEAYEADKKTPHGEVFKLGEFSFASINGFLIYNLYAMRGLGNDGTPLGRNLLYDRFYDGMHKICTHLEKNVKKEKIEVGIPKNIGCCRAGGSWEIVDQMLWDIESHFPHIEFVVYELSDAETKAQSTPAIQI